ncbi:MAG: hypothetical protein ACRD2H_00465 [Terriglobales bacterium]
MMRAASLFAVAALVAVALAQGGLVGTGPEIRVHLLEAKTGKPIAHAQVMVLTLGQWVPPPRKLLDLMGWTDRDGVAVFRLPDPPPRRLWVGPVDALPAWMACTPASFCTSDILGNGVAGANLCWPGLHKHGGPPPVVVARPGDVYIYAHHNTGLLFWLGAYVPGVSDEVMMAPPSCAGVPKVPPAAPPRRLEILILHGESARQVRNGKVLIWRGPRAPLPSSLPVRNGVAGIWVFPDDMSSSIRLRPVKPAPCGSWPPEGRTFQIADAMIHGITTDNQCGPARVAAKPGQIVLFAR